MENTMDDITKMVGNWVPVFSDPMKETHEIGEAYVHEVVRQVAGAPDGRRLLLCVVQFMGNTDRREWAILEPAD